MNVQRLIAQTEFNRDFIAGRNRAYEIYMEGGAECTFDVWLHGAECFQEGMPLDEPYLQGLWAFLHHIDPNQYSRDNGVVL